MKRFLFLLLLIILCNIGYSTKTIKVSETDLVNLVPEVYDPDNDTVTFSFTRPLNKYGVWQTNYGDAGEYNIRVTASDGENSTYEDVVLVVEKKEEAPVIDSYSPKDDVFLGEGSSKSFKVAAYDLNKDSLTYEWFVDGTKVEDGRSYVYSATYTDAGQHNVKVVVADPESKTEKAWSVNVEDDDRPPEFGAIGNVRLKENQKLEIRIKAKDPDDDSITFSAENLPPNSTFSGNTLTFKTDYDTVKKENLIDELLDNFHLLKRDFVVTFIAKSREYEIRKNVRISVYDVNRAPVLDEVADITINEGDVLKITGQASDPDEDNLSYSCSGWVNKCNYNTTYNDAGIYVMNLIVSDGFLYDSKEVVVKVNNVDRNPVLISSNYNPSVMEGNNIAFKVRASDPDGNKVKISAANLPQNASFENGVFNWTPGLDFTNKDINVTAGFTMNDGVKSVVDSILIKVYNKNQAPKIVNTSLTKEFTTYVGNQIKFEVFAEDPDEDFLEYWWRFGLFEECNGTSAHLRIFTIPGMKKVKVTVSDGRAKDSFEWKIRVLSYDDYLALLK